MALVWLCRISIWLLNSIVSKSRAKSRFMTPKSVYTFGTVSHVVGKEEDEYYTTEEETEKLFRTAEKIWKPETAVSRIEFQRRRTI